MEINYTDDAKNVLEIAQEQALNFHHQVIGTEHLLLGLDIESQGIAGKTLRRFGITPMILRDEIERMTGYGTVEPARNSANRSNFLPFSPRTKEILSYAAVIAKELGSPEVGTEHLLMGMLEGDDILANQIIMHLGINLFDLSNALRETLGLPNEARPKNMAESIAQNNRRAQRKAKLKSSTNDQTPILNELATNLNEKFINREVDPVIGRDQEVARVIQILSRRTKNNPVLLGEPGVGKTAIAEAIAQKIVHHEVPKDLFNKRIMMLDMGSLVAGTKYRGEFEDRVKKIMAEIKKSKDVILFIDEIHTLIGAGGAEGSVDASNILKPALARGEVQIIGATTYNEYQKYIEKDAALERRFAQVRVEEPSKKETEQILAGIRDQYEDFHGVKISDDAIEEAVNLSSRYITNRFLPDKAIDVLDEASAKVKIAANAKVAEKSATFYEEMADLERQKNEALYNQDFELAADIREKQIVMREKSVAQNKKQENKVGKEPTVTSEDVAEIISTWTGVPVSKMKRAETKQLINLERDLHQHIVGQNAAVDAVAKAIRRSRSGLKDPNRPIGSFLFLGPTGVGKTELAKTIAEVIFGSKNNLIRVDMSELMESFSTSKLIGSAPGYVGYEEGGQLSEKVRQNPYSVVLLDEVEKAHPDVFNLLLQVLDDGFMTDSKGRKVDFRNTIIIMTSNLGSRSLRDDKTVGFGTDEENTAKINEDKIKAATKQFFRPEFLNRVDEMVIFNELNEKELRKIVTLLTNELKTRLKDLEIDFKISTSALDLVAKNGFDPENGARPIRRAIQKELEDPISEMLIAGEIPAHSTLKVSTKNKQISINVEAPKEVLA